MRSLKTQMPEIITNDVKLIAGYMKIYLTADKKHYVFVEDLDEKSTHAHYWPLDSTVKKDIERNINLEICHQN